MRFGKLRSLSAVALFVAALPAVSAARIVDGIVAVVNDEPITYSEFRESVAENMGIPEGDADIYLREETDRNRILSGIETLVDSVLVRQALAKLGDSVSGRAVDRAVDSVMKSNKMSEAEFRQLLASEGISPNAYRRRIRWQLERSAIVRAKKMKEVTVTEEEMRAFFRENAERFLKGGEVRLETLYLPFPAGTDNADAIARTRIAAQQAADYVRSGMTFDEVARLLGSGVPDASVVSSDFVKTDDLVPEIAREVHLLKTGQASPPVSAGSGIYLVKVLGRRGGSLPEFSTVKEALQEELVNRRSERAFAEILVELKKAATIDVHL